jgi:hypothetical protein
VAQTLESEQIEIGANNSPMMVITLRQPMPLVPPVTSAIIPSSLPTPFLLCFFYFFACLVLVEIFIKPSKN